MDEPLKLSNPKEVHVRVAHDQDGLMVVAVQALFPSGLREVHTLYRRKGGVAALALEHLAVCEALDHDHAIYLVAPQNLFRADDDSGWRELKTLK
jgi:glucose/arabinose dehydrogenase